VKYYLKKSQFDVVEGPFSVEEINAAIASGDVTKESLATSDIGETKEQVRSAPGQDWIHVAEVPGVVGLPMPDQARPRRKAPDAVQLFYMLLLAGIVASVLWLLAWLRSLGRELH
jgi:hypothetical protein